MCPLVRNSTTHLTLVHIDNITNAKKYMSFVRKVVDHLPFLTTAGYFRIAASVLFITYLGTFGFVPIGVFWISLLFIGYKKFRLDLNPLWLISFVSLFVPACFTHRRIARRYLIYILHALFHDKAVGRSENLGVDE